MLRSDDYMRLTEEERPVKSLCFPEIDKYRF